MREYGRGATRVTQCLVGGHGYRRIGAQARQALDGPRGDRLLDELGQAGSEAAQGLPGGGFLPASVGI